jgi:hypothetical protein
MFSADINIFHARFPLLMLARGVLIIGILLVSPALAASHINPVLDLTDAAYNNWKNNLPPGNDYEICLYSDTEGIGHGFIKFKAPNDKWRGVGFYPGSLNVICGQGSMGDDTGHVWNHKRCYKGSREQFIRVLDKAREWRNKTYYLGWQNCISFVKDIIAVMGIPGIIVPIPTPGLLDDNLKMGGVENTNRQKSGEMVLDASGNWVPAGQTDNQTAAAPTRAAACDPDVIRQTVNQNAASMPREVASLVRDQRVQFTVQTMDLGTQQMGFVMQGTQVAQMTPTVDNPTVRVYTNDRTIQELFLAKDPLEAGRAALARGDIRIETNDPAQNAVLMGGGLLNRLGLLLQPPRYAIGVGQTRNVVINGQPSVLIRPRNVIMLHPVGSEDATVINTVGVTQGFSSLSAMRTISLSHQSHSPTSSVFTRPARLIITSAPSNFAPPPFYARQAMQARQYTMAGGARSSALLAGGAGFAYGFR